VGSEIHRDGAWVVQCAQLRRLAPPLAAPSSRSSDASLPSAALHAHRRGGHHARATDPTKLAVATIQPAREPTNQAAR
jgi:hypothetical protein